VSSALNPSRTAPLAQTVVLGLKVETNAPDTA
jgi:hypothetical protein